MWKKGAVVLAGGGLCIVALSLLRMVTTSPVSGEAAVPGEAKRPAQARFVSPSIIPASTPLPEKSAEPPRGPAAAVWRVLAKPHANVVEQREELIAAFRGSPPCSESWCDKGRSTLMAWRSAMSAQVPALNTGDIECGAAGCFVEVTVSDPLKWRDVVAAMPQITAQNNWLGPSIEGGPDFQTRKGSVISLWAILPAETKTQEEGAE